MRREEALYKEGGALFEEAVSAVDRLNKRYRTQFVVDLKGTSPPTIFDGLLILVERSREIDGHGERRPCWYPVHARVAGTPANTYGSLTGPLEECLERYILTRFDPLELLATQE